MEDLAGIQGLADVFPAIAAAQEFPGLANTPTMHRDAEAWGLVFRDCKTLEELTQAGTYATADFGGVLPDYLKLVGKEVRAKITAPVDLRVDHWAARMHDATTVEELLSTAELAGAEYAGQLPTALKELGRDLRTKLLSTTP
jgi:hypothetical protein